MTKWKWWKEPPPPIEPWWMDDNQVLQRMLAWTGAGPPPNYLQRAWYYASSSLKSVAGKLPETTADDLVFQAHMTKGDRVCIRSDAILAMVGTRNR